MEKNSKRIKVPKSRCAENGLPISLLISKVVQQITQLLQTLFSATPVKGKSDIMYKSFWSVVVLSSKIVINISRTYDELPCKGEPYWFSC